MPSLAEVNSLRAQLVAVKNDFSLGLIEFDVNVGEDEHAARHRLLYQLTGQFAQLLRLRRRLNHEVDRKRAAAGKGWRSERNYANAGNL